MHGDVVGDADPLAYRRDSVGRTHDRHVAMKTTPLTVAWVFESCVGHDFRLLGRRPRSQHTTSDDPDDQRVAFFWGTTTTSAARLGRSQRMPMSSRWGTAEREEIGD